MTQVIHVSYCRGDHLEPMGRLATKEHRIFFEYAPEFLIMPSRSSTMSK